MANSQNYTRCTHFPPHLTYVDALYRVKRRCYKLLHNCVIISIRLLACASSIRQRAPNDLIVLWFKCTALEYSTLIFYTESEQQRINFCPHFCENGVGAFCPIHRWCRYQPVASSSKRLCPCTRGKHQTSSIDSDHFETDCYTNL